MLIHVGIAARAASRGCRSSIYLHRSYMEGRVSTV